MLDYAKFEMYGKALDAYGELAEDEDLGPTDWTTVKEYVSCLNTVSEESPPVHPHESAATGLVLRTMHLQDTRLRFLNGKCGVLFAVRSFEFCIRLHRIA